jgi:hypothetical protein
MTPLVYVGGMARVRALTRLGSLFCLMSCAVFLWRQVAHQPTDLHRFIALYVLGILFAVAIRIWSLRQVVAVHDRWLLVPLIGPPRPMPAVRDAFVLGDDVVVRAFDGRFIVLGVDRFPRRDAAAIRHRLVRELPLRRWSAC